MHVLFVDKSITELLTVLLLNLDFLRTYVMAELAVYSITTASLKNYVTLLKTLTPS